MDPADPRYAEYAGVRYRGDGDRIRELVLAVAAGFGAIALTTVGLRRRRPAS